MSLASLLLLTDERGTFLRALQQRSDVLARAYLLVGDHLHAFEFVTNVTGDLGVLGLVRFLQRNRQQTCILL
jgi:hypothetical protein